MNISVIIPVYNAEKLVRKAVESALFHPEVKEVILIEDASPDNSLEVCKALTTEYERVILYQHKDGKNKGAGASRNLGIMRATQDYIGFLDADDYYSNNRFKKEKEIFDANLNADGVYGATGVHYIDDPGANAWENLGHSEQSLTTVIKPISPDQLFESLIIFNNINYGYFHLDAFTVRRSSLRAANILFDESLRLHQDTVFLQQCAYYLNLYTGEYQKPIAYRGIHKDNRFIHHKNLTDSRSRLYKNLIRWSKEADIRKEYQDLYRKKYNKLNPSFLSKLKSKYRKIKKGLRISFLKYYLGGKFDESRVILISSSPCSGSTMLSNALKAIPKSFVLFEPLQLTHVPEAKSAGFCWRTFIPANMKWPEGKTFLKKVFEGKVINDWTIREVSVSEAFYLETMIVKSVRTNRLLPWICNTFSIKKPILLLRHPCAVIASQLKSSTDWNQTKQPDIPEFIEDFPIFKAIILNTKTIEEHLAVTWALDQLPILMKLKTYPCIIVTYEELLLHPKKTLSNILNSWGQDIDIEDAVSRLKKPSSVVYKSGISGIDGWKKQLTTNQIDKILAITSKFGLTFYGKDEFPKPNLLHSTKLPDSICDAGKNEKLSQTNL
jgi:glycosyltransferase involved in cell wall biosynthesis